MYKYTWMAFFIVVALATGCVSTGTTRLRLKTEGFPDSGIHSTPVVLNAELEVQSQW